MTSHFRCRSSTASVVYTEQWLNNYRRKSDQKIPEETWGILLRAGSVEGGSATTGVEGGSATTSVDGDSATTTTKNGTTTTTTKTANTAARIPLFHKELWKAWNHRVVDQYAASRKCDMWPLNM